MEPTQRKEEPVWLKHVGGSLWWNSELERFAHSEAEAEQWQQRARAEEAAEAQAQAASPQVRPRPQAQADAVSSTVNSMANYFGPGANLLSADENDELKGKSVDELVEIIRQGNRTAVGRENEYRELEARANATPPVDLAPLLEALTAVNETLAQQKTALEEQTARAEEALASNTGLTVQLQALLGKLELGDIENVGEAITAILESSEQAKTNGNAAREAAEQAATAAGTTEGIVQGMDTRVTAINHAVDTAVTNTAQLLEVATNVKPAEVATSTGGRRRWPQR